MKRLSLLIVLIGLLLVSGCGSVSSPQEPFEFSVLFNQESDSPYQEDWLIVQEYLERKNVVLNVLPGDNADYATAVKQIFGVGEVPDIVLKVWPEEIEPYAASGVLLPFSDYEDQMPHFQAYIESHGLQGEIDKLRLDNGKYYILPGYTREIQVQQWIYRQDLFEAHALGVPQTYNELFEALVILKEQYPDSAPITATWGGAHLFAMMGAGYEIPAGWNGARSYNEQQDAWEFAPATENYREMLRFLNRCYKAGLLDPEIFTQSDTDYYAKLQDGRGLVTVSWITSGFDNWNQALAENGVPDGEWAPLSVPESTIGVRALPGVDQFRKGLVVPVRVVNEPYFDDLISFLDWAIYSDEGMTLTTWGVEGVTYQETAEGKVFMPEIYSSKNPEGTLDITAEYGLATMFNLNENEEYEDYKKPADIVKFLNISLEAGETAPLDPTLDLDSNSIEAARIIEEKANSYVATALQGFITGDLDLETDWLAYLGELEKLGYQTLEEIWNAAWEVQH